MPWYDSVWTEELFINKVRGLWLQRFLKLLTGISFHFASQFATPVRDFSVKNSSSCYTTFLELTIFFFLYHISRSWLINNAMNWRFFLLLPYKWWSYTFEFRYISAACSYFSRDYPGNFSSCLTNSRSNNASIAGNIYYVIDSSLAFIVFVYLSFDNIRSSSLLG